MLSRPQSVVRLPLDRARSPLAQKGWQASVKTGCWRKLGPLHRNCGHREKHRVWTAAAPCQEPSFRHTQTTEEEPEAKGSTSGSRSNVWAGRASLAQEVRQQQIPLTARTGTRQIVFAVTEAGRRRKCTGPGSRQVRQAEGEYSWFPGSWPSPIRSQKESSLWTGPRFLLDMVPDIGKIMITQTSHIPSLKSHTASLGAARTELWWCHMSIAYFACQVRSGNWKTYKPCWHHVSGVKNGNKHIVSRADGERAASLSCNQWRVGAVRWVLHPRPSTRAHSVRLHRPGLHNPVRTADHRIGQLITRVHGHTQRKQGAGLGLAR